jgi:hypothetical protein
MVKSPWVYRRLRNFRAGIEAGISCFIQARLWRRTLHLARPRPFQGLHLVRRGGPQPGLVRSPQTGIAPSFRQPAAIDHISLTRVARNAILSFLCPPPKREQRTGLLRHPFRLVLPHH